VLWVELACWAAPLLALQVLPKAQAGESELPRAQSLQAQQASRLVAQQPAPELAP
jgi:hypothetical protein